MESRVLLNMLQSPGWAHSWEVSGLRAVGLRLESLVLAVKDGSCFCLS